MSTVSEVSSVKNNRSKQHNLGMACLVLLHDVSKLF